MMETKEVFQCKVNNSKEWKHLQVVYGGPDETSICEGGSIDHLFECGVSARFQSIVLIIIDIAAAIIVAGVASTIAFVIS